MALRKKRREIPYWLAPGEELCAVCERPHATAVTVFCVACDRPQCTFCITVISGEALCPDCDEEKRRPRRWLRGRSGKAS